MKVQKLIDAMVSAYLEAVVFTDCGDDSDVPKGAQFADVAIIEACATCADFLAQAMNAGLWRQWIDAGMTIGSFAYDYWLTRNGHGAGFWDRGLGELGDKLSDMAQTQGSVYAYAGDDCLIYFGWAKHD